MITENRYLDVPEIARMYHTSTQRIRYYIQHDDHFPQPVMLENHPIYKGKPKQLFVLTEIRRYLDNHVLRTKPAPVKTFVSWTLGTEKRPMCKPITQPFRRHVRVTGWDFARE